MSVWTLIGSGASSVPTVSACATPFPLSISLLFPAGTIFNQEIFTCVWWFDFDCNTAESFYSLNDNLYEETSAPASGGGRGQSKPSTSGGQKSGGGRGQARPSTSGGRKAGGSRGRPSPATVTAVLEFPESEESFQHSEPLPLYGSPAGRRGRGEGEVENPFYDYN